MDSRQVDMNFEERDIYTVQQLNREVKQLLQQNFPLMWVEGELSNVARPASGHIYFSLKDSHAQVRCAMFRNANRALPFKPEDGMQVLVRARVGVYEPRGEYQLTVEHMEEAGVGALQRKFEALKQKLNQEGLFDHEQKQTLPAYPQTVSIVTSATGAALRDILSVLKRRYPLLVIRIYAVAVQGDESATEIVNALDEINKHQQSDVIILARGGGSIEDLWSFNEEKVARAIFASEIPIVSGVGHETDFTIADFVADVRAPTPSAAAELITPNQEELFENFAQFQNTFVYFMQDLLSNFNQAVDWLTQRLEYLHPKQTIVRQQEYLNELQRRANSAIELTFSKQNNALDKLQIRLESKSPQNRVSQARLRLQQLQKQIYANMGLKLQQKQHSLLSLTRTLDAISPLNTLARGYAIATHQPTGQILLDVAQVASKDSISIKLAKGSISAMVEDKSED